MASSEVDQKFLGKLARAVEPSNALLSSMLYKILGLSINLAGHLVKARKHRKLDTTRMTQSLELYLHIIWLSREGLVMLEQYVLPMVGDHVELKVLAFKLRASFYHIFVLFHNSPPVSTMTPEALAAAAAGYMSARLDKGKGVARDDDIPETARSSLQPTHVLEGGPVGPPPGFGPVPPEAVAAFLLPAVDYLPTAHNYFIQAIELADQNLWGSHSLRLSLKTEYAAFLYECVHDAEGSRKLAKKTISEVYEAQEGMDDDMFADACELVTVLGKMMKRGLGSS
ncbi:14-3-3 domain-containing protein, partial [Truncatella angustata]